MIFIICELIRLNSSKHNQIPLWHEPFIYFKTSTKLSSDEAFITNYYLATMFPISFTVSVLPVPKGPSNAGEN